MAAQASKVFQLLVGFHAFGNNLQLQPVSHGDDGIHDTRAVFTAADGFHERLVNLEGMDGQTVKVIQ